MLIKSQNLALALATTHIPELKTTLRTLKMSLITSLWPYAPREPNPLALRLHLGGQNALP